MQLINGVEAENVLVRRDAEGNMPVLPSGQNTNLKSDDMAIIHRIGITIDDENYPMLESVPTQQQQQQGQGQQGGEVWKSEGVIYP